MALVPSQSVGRGVWSILSLLSPGCVTLEKPLDLSEYLDPHLENAYDPRFNEKTKQHDVCGHALEAMKCTVKARAMTLH